MRRTGGRQAGGTHAASLDWAGTVQCRPCPQHTHRHPRLVVTEPGPVLVVQVTLPEQYLKTAYEAVRGVGGLCVADEVQTGFGRVGSHFWAFETQGTALEAGLVPRGGAQCCWWCW